MRRLPAVLLVLAAAACGAATPNSVAYTFNPNSSPVKVDTPQLRALKASAHIRPCPKVTAAATGAGAAQEAPNSLPNITLPCLGGGREVDLADLRGPLVLNFWAQTCGPCREESPLLQQFASAHNANSANGRVKVIGVDFFDPRPSYALGFAKQLGLTYPQIADPEAATKAALHIAGLPMTFFVDRSGQVSFTQVGAITSRAELDRLVRAHLGASGTPGSSS